MPDSILTKGKKLLSEISGDSFAEFVKIKIRFIQSMFIRFFITPFKLRKNAHLKDRCLEIGPGQNRIEGFETIDTVPGKNVDYVVDASKRLPFQDGTFEVVYASHVLEHISWFKVEKTLKEWIRILKPGGQLEIWVPDGYKICKAVAEAEHSLENVIPDGWLEKNTDKNIYVWASGRIFWGGNDSYPSWHHSLFTPKYLTGLFKKIGLENIEIMSSEKVRGKDHGWINLGITGTKL